MNDDFDIILILIGVGIGIGLGFIIKVAMDQYILLNILPI
jgi:hypothetical protein